MKEFKLGKFNILKFWTETKFFPAFVEYRNASERLNPLKWDSNFLPPHLFFYILQCSGIFSISKWSNQIKWSFLVSFLAFDKNWTVGNYFNDNSDF